MRRRKRTRFTFSEAGHPFREGDVVELEGLPGKYRVVWTESHWISVEEMTWWGRLGAWFFGE